MQAAYKARGHQGEAQTAQQEALLCEVYEALDAPLDERFRMLHPCLWHKPKRDDSYSAPWGMRGQWLQGTLGMRGH